MLFYSMRRPKEPFLDEEIVISPNGKVHALRKTGLNVRLEQSAKRTKINEIPLQLSR